MEGTFGIFMKVDLFYNLMICGKRWKFEHEFGHKFRQGLAKVQVKFAKTSCVGLGRNSYNVLKQGLG